ncbi:TPA: hypothetical protein ENS27_12290 [bacterium]|nr:hypothetical protein [bacterium]
MDYLLDTNHWSYLQRNHPNILANIQNLSEDGAVMLEPDVKEYFPDSESVNNALRSLISLIPDKH